MECRKEWLNDLLRIASPVIDSLEKQQLKALMPLDFHPDRACYAPLEAFGRTLLGLSPWLEVETDRLSDDEQRLQREWRKKVVCCLEQATDPSSADYMNFDRGSQPLVDTAFLAHGLLRCRHSVTNTLPERIRRFLADAFRSSRVIVPGSSNWLFFSAMVEAGLYLLGEEYDMTRVLYALRTFRKWYVGDGTYGDGEYFHWDYYNSFVIQPMYVDLVSLFAPVSHEIQNMKEQVLARAVRYAAIQERMIAPDGSYPIVGRSICYRFGAFQLLAQMALEHRLEKPLTPAGVRSGLTAVIRKVMSSADMFDKKGWLLPGVYGNQPELAETYICIGSLYLCTAVFLPLGLPPEDSFWKDPDAAWTNLTVWSGQHTVIDHAAD